MIVQVCKFLCDINPKETKDVKKKFDEFSKLRNATEIDEVLTVLESSANFIDEMKPLLSILRSPEIIFECEFDSSESARFDDNVRYVIGDTADAIPIIIDGIEFHGMLKKESAMKFEYFKILMSGKFGDSHDMPKIPVETHRIASMSLDFIKFINDSCPRLDGNFLHHKLLKYIGAGDHPSFWKQFDMKMEGNTTISYSTKSGIFSHYPEFISDLIERKYDISISIKK